MRFFFLVLGVLSLTACTELTNVINDNNMDDINTSLLSTSAMDYITANYPNYVIDDVDNDIDCNGTSIIEIELKAGFNEIELVFDTEDNFLYEVSEIRASDLPTAVTNSIATNFPNYILDDNEADKLTMADGSLRYEVELESVQDDLEVVFGADGTVICQQIESDDDDDDDDNNNNIDSLPTTASAYITANYPNYIIEDVDYDMTCDSTMVIEVEIENGNSEIDLTFDLNGNFLYSEVEISTVALPTAVTNSIATNFPNYSLDDNEADELTMTDGSLRYEVDLESMQNDLEVLFAADGTVICQEIDND